ncbi:MAG: cobalamin biosynthesis protein [Nitrospinae bacterium]|nr:cobalamin biosynthesis protein [Nitrospinota bacterium]
MKIALITLSNEGARVVGELRKTFGEADAFFHERVTVGANGARFSKMGELTARIFGEYDGLVYVAPCGAVVRATAGMVGSKLKDPAVVVLDAGGRYAISLLSGHEGGANDLAVTIGNATGAEPVITTTADAVKNVVVGVGCRKGKESDKIMEAISKALSMAGVEVGKVRYIASADVKRDEPGLIEAARRLNVPLRFVSGEEIKNSSRDFGKSDFVEKNVDLPAVAEPAALLAGRRTTLILRKTAFEGITVALARENCSSLE